MMRLLRRRSQPRTTTIRPAERYLFAGADEARRLGHKSIGTEHVLLALTREPDSPAARILRQLGVTHGDISESECLGPGSAPRIDASALATLGIDLETVRGRLEATFGPGALEQTQAGCTGIMPRLKVALAHALDLAGDQPVQDQHVLLGLLSVPDSLAAHLLAERGVSLEDVQAVVRTGDSA
jgi:ATP-dependent Clp protease ATP-binding subunit ClpA